MQLFVFTYLYLKKNYRRCFRQARSRRRWYLSVRPLLPFRLCMQLTQILSAGSLFATLASNGVYFAVGANGDGPLLWASLAL